MEGRIVKTTSGRFSHSVESLPDRLQYSPTSNNGSGISLTEFPDRAEVNPVLPVKPNILIV